MGKRKACPKCDSDYITRWTGGAWVCRVCRTIFREPKVIEYVPERTYAKRDISSVQERYNAKLMGGRVTPNSGATSTVGNKSDVKAEDLRVECKSTISRSYALKLLDLETNEAHAGDGEMPVLSLEFRPRDEGERKKQYMIVPEPWFMQLLDAWRASRDQDHR